jgi:hypothetical protein
MLTFSDQTVAFTMNQTQPKAASAVILPKPSPETILREALEVARDELKRINDHYSCVRPDPFGVVIQALAAVPPLPPIPHASEIEKRIVYRLVTDLLAAGYQITVNDGEDDTVIKATDPDVIWPALASTDMDTLKVTGHPVKRRSFVELVWGNDCDVISDYGVSLEEVVSEANKLAESLQ